MTSTLSIEPEDVLSAHTSWEGQVLDYVKDAAHKGASVTLTAKPRMLTPAQMGDMFGLSRTTISRRIADGTIKAVKVGNRNRIPYIEAKRYWKTLMADMVDETYDDLMNDLFGE